MSGTTSTAPKVTIEQIEAQIEKTVYFTGDQGNMGNGQPSDPTLGLVTFCMLRLKNGFTAIGKSAVASPENYDKALGEKYAREDAIRQCWAPMGYELKTFLKKLSETLPPSKDDMPAYITSSCTYAKPFSRQEFSDLLGHPVHEGKDPSEIGYMLEMPTSGNENIEGYTGYCIWVPKVDFENDWRLIGGIDQTGGGSGDYLSRMVTEKTQLQDKIKKLQDFNLSSQFGQLDVTERLDLNEQLQAMNSYMMALTRRISRAQFKAQMPTV